MKDYITTFTKIHFNPLEPNAEDICIQDIAHALSMMTRANGHFPEFYSIAQHSIHCAQEAVARNFTNRTVLACLLHDASEAYLSDITRPVKRRMLKYKQYERVLQSAIYEKFLPGEITPEEKVRVKAIDDTLLFFEFKHYMQEDLEKPRELLYSNPIFEVRNFEDVEREYLDIFYKFQTFHKK